MQIPFENTYAKLPGAFYRRVDPAPVKNPELIAWNAELAEQLGIEDGGTDPQGRLAVFSGNQVPEGADPVAMAYAGHQFGGYSPQLGDGRALLLGEVVGRDGVRRDLQLKGSGPTPFSRRGDGRSALGPVLREYLVSEAMAALGVPTTRALAAVATGEPVVRDGVVPGGVFTRVAQSHLRIGTFQYFAANRDYENLQVLADYAIDRHYPEARESENRYLALLAGVMERQAHLIAHWMQLGFIHGVMNTDNMSISGETIDFGPCAFLDTFHPAKKFSSIDRHGRYAYSNQAPIGQWNLVRLAETLIPLLGDEPDSAIEHAKGVLDRFPEIHEQELRARLLAKIGIESHRDDPDGDWALVEDLLALMTRGEADFTLGFRHLVDALEPGGEERFAAGFRNGSEIDAWLCRWRERLGGQDPGAAAGLMRRTNPVFIPRNHRIEEVIAAAYGGDYSPFRRLHEVLKRPFEEQPGFEEFEAAPQPSEVVQATFCGT